MTKGKRPAIRSKSISALADGASQEYDFIEDYPELKGSLPFDYIRISADKPFSCLINKDGDQDIGLTAAGVEAVAHLGIHSLKVTNNSGDASTMDAKILLKQTGA